MTNDTTARGARRLHVACLTASKLADSLVDAKLVLPWAMNALGAPAALIGLLSPVRESLALALQGPLAPRIAAAPLRKRVWAAGAALQGLAAAGMGAAALLGGPAAPWIILGLLVLLASARALSSLSHKDALARTVPKGARGSVGGLAAALAAAASLLWAAGLSVGFPPLSLAAVGGGMVAAGALWLGAALLFLRLPEQPDVSEARSATARFREALAGDGDLRRFIAVRALLTATALAPPWLVVLSGSEAQGGLGALGPLLIASAAASILSGPLWGRLADRSSRGAMALSGALAGAVFAAAAAAGALSGGLGGAAGAAAAMFVAQVAHQGVRTGRKTQLTDMSDDDDRAINVALSNVLIGAFLALGGGLGLLAVPFGPAGPLAAFALMALAAAPLAMTLENAQRD